MRAARSARSPVLARQVPRTRTQARRRATTRVVSAQASMPPGLRIYASRDVRASFLRTSLAVALSPLATARGSRSHVSPPVARTVLHYQFDGRLVHLLPRTRFLGPRRSLRPRTRQTPLDPDARSPEQRRARAALAFDTSYHRRCPNRRCRTQQFGVKNGDCKSSCIATEMITANLQSRGL